MWQVEQAGLLYGTIPPKYPLVTHQLADAGYHVGYTGKGWGPGDWQAGGLTRNPTGAEFNSRQFATVPREGLDTRDYAANFADFLRQRPARAPSSSGSAAPSHIGLTLPTQAWPPASDLMSHVPAYWPDTPRCSPRHARLLRRGRMLRQPVRTRTVSARRIWRAQNTLVLVTSRDNGMPFPRAKVNLYDRGIHMPLAMRWGSRFHGGRTVDDVVQHIDFAPTFLEAAGLPVPRGHGRPQPSALLDSGRSGGIDPSRDAAFTAMERHVMVRACRSSCRCTARARRSTSTGRARPRARSATCSRR